MGSLGLMEAVDSLDHQALQVERVLLEILGVLVCLLGMEELVRMGYKDRGGLKARME